MAAMLEQGIPVAAAADLPHLEQPAATAQVPPRHLRAGAVAALSSGAHAGERHLRIGCPAFQAPPSLIEQHEGLALAALAAQQPTPRLLEVAGRVQAQVRRVGGGTSGGSSGGGYSMLRLQAAQGWVAQCTRWQRRGERSALLPCAV